MHITAIKAYPISGPWTDLCFVKVETDQAGLYGWGEASLPGRSGAVAAAIADISPLVIGMDATEIERIWQRMYRHTYWRGGGILTSSISGIDIALWDIRGKALGLPVYKLLGGAVRDRISLYANIGNSSDPAVLRDRAVVAVEQGYQSVKFYPLIEDGGTDRHDAIQVVVECCAAVRDAIGSARGMCIDFHGRCLPHLAVQIEAEIRAFRPTWIEEPINAENVAGYQMLAQKFATPLALGERYFTRWGFRELFEQRIVSYIQPDAANAGGISEMMRLAAMAELYGVALAPHNCAGPLLGIASLHIAAAAPAFAVLELVDAGYEEEVETMRKYCTVIPATGADGFAALPDGPGLGVDMNENILSAMPYAPFAWQFYHADGAVADW